MKNPSKRQTMILNKCNTALTEGHACFILLRPFENKWSQQYFYRN